ncbi:MAG TPA: hypothetical protein VH142_02580, partial [Polyangiaceae bacterium]|nr:hypothetical protein [Polyangiaceae bacterium]
MTRRARFVARVARLALLASSTVVVACSSNDGVGQGRDYLGGEAGVASCPMASGNCPASGPSYAT